MGYNIELCFLLLMIIGGLVFLIVDVDDRVS